MKLRTELLHALQHAMWDLKQVRLDKLKASPPALASKSAASEMPNGLQLPRRSNRSSIP